MVVSKRAGVGVLTLAAAFGLANLPAQAEESVARGECEVAVAAEALPVTAEPVVVQASYTEAIGEELVVGIEEESGIRLISAGREDDDEPQTLRLTLDTSEAAVGAWTLVLRGDDGECTGTVVVVEDGR